MLRYILPTLLLATASPLAGQAPPPAAPPAPTAADVAAARAFFEALADPARIDAVGRDLISPRAVDYEPVERLVRRIRALAVQSGGIDISEWTERGDQVRFAGTSRRGGVPVRGIIGLADGRLVGFQIERDRRLRPADAPAWPASAASESDALAAIDRELAWLARSERFSGTVLISRRGRPALERAYGLARRGPDAASTIGTPFHTASTTKMLTAAAVGRLVDQGRLTLDATVAAAVPRLAAAPRAGEIRLRDLLGHRVSYGDYLSSDAYRAIEREGATATELVRLVADRAPTDARPGRISYSNANYLVLAAAIEAASGISYYDFLERELFRPLGMADTLFGRPDARPDRAAIGWIKDDETDPLGTGPWRANDGIVPLRGGPPGGTWSSARDLSRFIEALAAGRIVSPATLEAMLSDRRTGARGFDHALGFMINNAAGRLYFGHDGGGGNAGVSTSVFTARDGAWSVVVLSNLSSPAGDDLGKRLIDLLLAVPDAPGLRVADMASSES